MSDQLWLGAPAVDGARVGPLFLHVERGLAYVELTGGTDEDSYHLGDWCPLSEVDARTRAWLASLAALVPGPRCAVCNGTGIDENLDREKLDYAVAKVLERADELDQEAAAVRAHFELGCAIAAAFLELQLIASGGAPSNPEWGAWLSAENKRVDAAKGKVQR